MKKTITTFLFLLSLATMQAQSPVGNWEMTSSIVENSDGTKDDVQKKRIKTMPCSATIIYSFLANGKTTSTVTDCTAAIKKMVEALNEKSRWVQKGNKIIISVTDNSFPESIYRVSYSGNTMTMTLYFSENPDAPNPFKSKSIQNVYQKN